MLADGLDINIASGCMCEANRVTARAIERQSHTSRRMFMLKKELSWTEMTVVHTAR